jgi:LacI family transcriptional regulator
MTVTIKDIAAALGLSSATVSMALNNRKGINAETRKRVLDYVNSIDYVLPALKNQKTAHSMLHFIVYRKYGRVLSDTQFFSELIESVEASAKKHGHSVTLSYCNSAEQSEETIKSIQAHKPSGLLLLATEMDAEDIKPFCQIGLPTVLLDCDLPDCGLDTVLINNEEGLRDAVLYLYNRGHRDIGYAHSAFSIRNFEQRARGYRDTMEELGIACEDKYIYSVEPSTEAAFSDVCSIISGGAVLPSAIICDNDIIACGVVKALKQNGYCLPEDISLIGFDNVELCVYMEPELTSVHVPKRTLGDMAVRQLLRRIQNPDEPTVKILIGTEIKERYSVK